MSPDDPRSALPAGAASSERQIVQAACPHDCPDTCAMHELAADGKNANEVTHQRLTDLGRAATFYDCLVQVRRVPDPS